MKLSIIWSVFLILSLNSLWSQIPDYSIVHFHNGTVLIGKILSDDGPDVQMSLNIDEEIRFPKFKVKHYLDSKEILVYPNGKFHFTSGFFFNTAFGMNLESIFNEEEGLISSHLPLIFGYNFSSRIALGVGFGFEFNEAQISGFRLDTQFAPWFLYGRYYFTEKKKRLYAYSRIGYGFRGDDGEFTNDHEGGVQYQTGLGVMFASRRKSKFVLSIGYHLQKTNGSENFIDPFGNEIFTEYNIWIKRLILHFGVELNWRKHKYN